MIHKEHTLNRHVIREALIKSFDKLTTNENALISASLG